MMEFLIGASAITLPVVAIWFIFWRRMKDLESLSVPYREGAVRPWEVEAEERAERRRINAVIEEELIRRAA